MGVQGEIRINKEMYNRGRRSSLPVQSLSSNTEFGKPYAGSTRRRKKKKDKKLPCVELAKPPEHGCREDAISEDLQGFIKEIDIDESDRLSDEEKFLKDLPYNERVRMRNKLKFGKLHGSNSSINSEILKHLGIDSSSSSLQGSKQSSRRGSSESMDELIDEDEVQQYLANEKKITKFTEMEIVALWNQFKLNFPHGTVSKPQLTELLQKVNFKRMM